MNNIHVRVDYNQALNSKREVLLIQESLLKSIMHMKKYNSLRKIEFSLKNKIKKDIFELNKRFISLQEHFPREEASMAQQITGKSKRKDIIVEKTESREMPKEKKPARRNELEYELQEIREKLARLS